MRPNHHNEELRSSDSFRFIHLTYSTWAHASFLSRPKTVQHTFAILYTGFGFPLEKFRFRFIRSTSDRTIRNILVSKVCRWSQERNSLFSREVKFGTFRKRIYWAVTEVCACRKNWTAPSLEWHRRKKCRKIPINWSKRFRINTIFQPIMSRPVHWPVAICSSY